MERKASVGFTIKVRLILNEIYIYIYIKHISRIEGKVKLVKILTLQCYGNSHNQSI